MRKANPVIFRNYDIRGIIPQQLHIDNVYQLTQAIVTHYHSIDHELSTLIVGFDGRIHSPQIKDVVIRSLTDTGINVINIGLCPTPAFYFACHTLKAEGGIMITASHNSSEYNGFKLCFKRKTIWGRHIKKISEIYYKKVAAMKTMQKQGIVTSYPIIKTYTDWLCHHFKHLKNMSLSVVIDCSHATAGSVLPAVVKKMNWKHITLLNETIDGTFPRHEPDPTQVRNMSDVRDALKSGIFNLGIGFDGDADRMVPMSSHGSLFSGDETLMLFALSLLKEHKDIAVVYDTKTTHTFAPFIAHHGGRAIISPSGHAHIKETMERTSAVLGGEQSSHFFFKDRYFGYDDGIYAALRLFESLLDMNVSLDQFHAMIPRRKSSPEIRIPCTEKDKTYIMKAITQHFKAQKHISLSTRDGIKAELPYGWGLIRASHTQAALSLRFESSTDSDLQKIKKEFGSLLENYFDKKQLKEAIDY